MGIGTGHLGGIGTGTDFSKSMFMRYTEDSFMNLEYVLSPVRQMRDSENVACKASKIAVSKIWCLSLLCPESC